MNYFLFAFKNIKKKGVRSWLTLLGIVIGIFAVVALITLGNAMKVAVTSQFGVSSTEVLTVQAGGLKYGPPGSSVANPLVTKDVSAINKISSVEFAVGRNIQTISVEFNNFLDVSSAVSIKKGYEKEIYEILDDVEAEYGRLLKKGDSKKIVLGNNFYNGKTNGFEKDIVPGKTILINKEPFKVAGILKKKGSFMYDNAIFMYNNELKELSNYGDNIDIIIVKVKNKDLVEKTEKDIEKLLRHRRNVKVGEEDFDVTTSISNLKKINSILGAIQAFIIVIASISILVGSIGIINTMTTSVLERKKEIGIMKSIGSRNLQIFLQFFVESGFLGFIGGIIGVFLGIIAGYLGTFGINNWLGTEIQTKINFVLIFFALLGSFLIGAISGIIPAMKAAKQNPVEALRE